MLLQLSTFLCPANCQRGEVINGYGCRSCGAGMYPDKNRTVCKRCSPGSFAQESSATCKLCSPGTFAADVGTKKCSRCDVIGCSFSNPPFAVLLFLNRYWAVMHGKTSPAKPTAMNVHMGLVFGRMQTGPAPLNAYVKTTFGDRTAEEVSFATNHCTSCHLNLVMSSFHNNF